MSMVPTSMASDTDDPAVRDRPSRRGLVNPANAGCQSVGGWVGYCQNHEGAAFTNYFDGEYQISQAVDSHAHDQCGGRAEEGCSTELGYFDPYLGHARGRWRLDVL